MRELENVIERLVVTGKHELVKLEELPPEIRAQRGVSLRPKRERRRTVADDLYKRLVEDKESFWTSVYPALHAARDHARRTCASWCAAVSRRRAATTRSSARLFNMESGDYKRFLNFLRKHDCQLPFKEYRQ